MPCHSYKLTEILYQAYKPCPNEAAINSFGIRLENGAQSPIFRGKEKDLTSLMVVKMAKDCAVQKIVARIGACSDINSI
jgi:hypothetical protein